MIDTIILSIPRPKTIELDLRIQGVGLWGLQSRAKGFEKYIRNPSINDKKTGLYFPRLTGIKRTMQGNAAGQTLKIEFSAPKLIYKNNLDELEENDFDRLVQTLGDRMKRMGIIVSREVLEQASVTAVHYSKNIVLSGGYTSQYVLSELGKINLAKRFDLTRARYMNDGQSITLYTIAHSLILYDKIADLVKPDKRAIDKEQGPYQRSLFESLEKQDEVLRFEVRLSKKQKLNQVFAKLGYGTHPTFRQVFMLEKSLAVMGDYWQSMIKGSATALFAYSLTAKDLLKQILIADNTLKPKQALYLTGLLQTGKEGNGLREARTILVKYGNDRTWYRIMDDYKAISERLSILRPRDWLEQISNQLTNYKAFQTERLSTCPVKKSQVKCNHYEYDK